MTLEAVVLGGLVVVVAAFGFAMANAARSPGTADRRDYPDGGPGVLVSDSGSTLGAGESIEAGEGHGGNGGGGDGGNGDSGGDGGSGD